MLSVSVLNILRQRALPETDFTDAAQVLTSLNTMFQMDRHDGMFFTIWYGVYDVKTRLLRHGCAGHHAGYIVPTGGSQTIPLREAGLIIGALADTPFGADQVSVPAGASLYLFSDGVFEIVTKEGRQWRLGNFLPMLLEPAIPDSSEPQRLYRAVRDVSRSGPFDDDFSILVLTFV
jgi:sigma-B regulation protein RsbU (phosphoserine phosphatase)